MRIFFQRSLFCLFLLVISSNLSWGASKDSPPQSAASDSSKSISGVGSVIWQNNFSAPGVSQIDTSTWTKNLGNYRRELPVINSPENVFISGPSTNKNLEIITSKIYRPSLYKGWCTTAPCQFVSGEITTRDKLIVKYGYIEAKIKMPSGIGNWPALWMLPDGNYGDSHKATPGEIDNVEWYGNKPTLLNFTLHSNTPPGQVNDSEVHTYFDTKQDLSQAFHLYGVAWMPGNISIYFDNNLVKTFSSGSLPAWPFNNFYYLILQGSVGPQPNTIYGGNWSGWQTSSMKISWVKISKYQGFGEVQILNR